MGSRVYYNRWDEAEDEQIRRLAGRMSAANIAKLLHRTEEAVKTRARKLDVSLRSGGQGKFWSEAEDAFLREHAENTTYVEIAEMLGRTPAGCERRARMLGLFHNPERKYYPKRQKEERVCHDCGKPTSNYRCAECWRKLRSEQNYDYEEDV